MLGDAAEGHHGGPDHSGGAASAFLGWLGACTGSTCELTLTDDLALTATFAPSGQRSWARTYPSDANGEGTTLATMANGDIILGSKTSVQAKAVGVIQRLSPTDREPIWTKKFVQDTNPLGGPSFALDALAPTPDGDIVVVGQFFGKLVYDETIVQPAVSDVQTYVGRIDGATGALEWMVNFGNVPNPNSAPQRLALDATGNVYVSGQFSGPFTFAGTTTKSEGLAEIFVAELSPSGQPVWLTTMGSAQNDFPADIDVIDSLGLLAIGGHFSGSLKIPRVGGGEVLPANGTATDVFLARLSLSNGLSVDAKRYGGIGADKLADLLVDADQLFTLGVFDTSIDLGGGPLSGTSGTFVLTQTAGGTHKQSFSLATSAIEPQVLTSDGRGSLWLTGRLKGAVTIGNTTLDGTGSAIAAKRSSDGTILAAHQYGGPGNAAPAFAIATPSSVYITGYIYGIADFGGQSLTTTNQTDPFVYAFVP